eukprot:CAMPEP_0194291628 /NCGR_PEP_ID=MMETSP0169-20130528/43779_1 /TAXON_ID=218684 /ORGANISM="Corethron pennatum, Strain L29A3" /LENGTH=112 /DNA_ID=CAMNT_0039039569 /DNA_START=345 /DNA_END=679 /DNA_ORIENTATION=+
MKNLDGDFASSGGVDGTEHFRCERNDDDDEYDDDDNDEEDNEDDKGTEPNITGIPVQFPCLSRIPLDSKNPEEFSGAERVSPGETRVGDRGEDSEAALATGGGDVASVPSST